ncbi:MAG TPA: hypothetical protein DC049_18665 [Spirochaetia bacterium]|nr:hypothetical protein [Spirochaetia bacterium]
MNRIRSQLQHIRTSAKASFNISDLIHEISREMKLETAFLHIDASCSKTITFDLKIIRSIIFNLLDNSIKAFLKKYGTLRHLGIKIMMSDFTMIYEDNCGGCDINELKGGIISEEPEPGHGYFNFYLLKKGYIFNIDADVERTSSGLRYKITFKT